ncbi:hypothetical protein [Kineococcus sp. SYSU DK006]|uniref:hypothetical protein n=1 Tax=Kineococcus sp. SYSU DK006 TaxID=3383127 RepID=UPI003D7D3B5A
MLGSGGNRLTWDRLPRRVHEAVAALLGSPVVRALSQPGGFSPGSADRVVTAAGQRAFVKAVSPAQNGVSPRLQAREARITAALPPGLPVPGFLGATTAGEWEVLVLEDVDGRHPALPWCAAELRLVLDALAGLAGRAAAAGGGRAQRRPVPRGAGPGHAPPDARGRPGRPDDRPRRFRRVLPRQRAAARAAGTA